MKTLVLHKGSVVIVVGEGAISQVARHLHNPTSIVIVTDQRVGPLYARRLADHVGCCTSPLHEWVLPLGEGAKSIRESERLYDFLSSKRVDRRGAILALGGGLVGDLAGFVAGTWQRGITWVNCPTTLLAAVDASIGGKTGVNHAGHKNCIGVFHQPDAVLIDTSALSTLDRRMFNSGMAESIKHGVVADAAFLDWQSANAEAIRNTQPEILEQLIVRNLEIKNDIVERDELDISGERAALNLGHTIGHAIEAASNFTLPHGECVAIGIVGAMYVAKNIGLVDDDAIEKVRRVLEMFSLPTRLDNRYDDEAIMAHLRADKKSVSGVVRFSLPLRIGRATSGHPVAEEQVRRALERLRK